MANLLDLLGQSPKQVYGLLSFLNDKASQPALGMDANIPRLSLLPRYSSSEGLVAPQVVYDAARAFAAPGQAWRGNEMAPQDAMNLAMMMQTSAMPQLLSKPKNGVLGITAYHGSPHKFDKFDMSKVGTGEGAQAFGHGLYLAENPNVAKNYGYVGGQDFNSVIYKGQEFSSSTRDGNLLFDIAKKGKAAVINNLKAQADRLATIHPAESSNLLSRIEFAKTVNPDHVKVNTGNMYKVDLPDKHIAKMLDWDKPLSQQSESVRKALQNAPFELGGGDWHGSQIVDAAASYAGAGKGGTPGKNNAAGSELLKSLGIPGIKYLDQGSRSTGKGTQNFVIFDENIAKIIGKE